MRKGGFCAISFPLMGRKASGEKRERIRAGSVSLALFRHPKGWRFSWKDPETGAWKYGTRTTRAAAVAAAHAQALLLQRGAIDLASAVRDPAQASIFRRVIELGLTHTDLDKLAAVRALPAVPLSRAIAEFLQAKRRARGPSTRNLRTLVSHLGSLAAHLGPGDPALGDITPEAIEAWMHAGDDPAPRTVRNRRGVAVTFWRWCRARRLLPEETTAAERTERPIVHRGIPATWEPRELAIMLKACPPDHLPWLALSAFAGLRQEELYQPDSRSRKDILRWSDYDPAGGLLIVRPEVSKVGHRRIIPVPPVLAAWLHRIDPGSGATDPRSPLCGGCLPYRSPDGKAAPITRQLGHLVGGWRINALRHSWISYRAVTVGLAQTAMEAGNSESEARRSYHDAKTRAEADAWFSLTPPVIFGTDSEPAAKKSRKPLKTNR